jgi:hypothetical protein
MRYIILATAASLISFNASANDVEQQFNDCLRKATPGCDVTIEDVVNEKRKEQQAPLVAPLQVTIVEETCVEKPYSQRSALWECSAPVTPWDMLYSAGANKNDPTGLSTQGEITVDKPVIEKPKRDYKREKKRNKNKHAR